MNPDGYVNIPHGVQRYFMRHGEWTINAPAVFEDEQPVHEHFFFGLWDSATNGIVFVGAMPEVQNLMDTMNGRRLV